VELHWCFVSASYAVNEDGGPSDWGVGTRWWRMAGKHAQGRVSHFMYALTEYPEQVKKLRNCACITISLIY
jgi:hypothetical protein